MDHANTASQIVAGVGGAANVTAVDQCMTRLRLTLAEAVKVDSVRIQAIPGVLGVVMRGGQLQIVLGATVSQVTAHVQTQLFGTTSPAQPTPATPSSPASAPKPPPRPAANFADLGAAIIARVGGPANISALEHCSTRLRFTLVDPSHVDAAALRATPGVLGVVTTVQTQVIIGNAVTEVYRAILQAFPGIGGNAAPTANASAQKQGIMAIVVDFIIGVFQPVVPAIAGAGMLKAMLVLLSYFGWLPAASPTYKVLSAVPDGVFYYLGFMVAVTTATKLKIDRLVAIAAVAPLLLPSLSPQISQGISVFGVHITPVPYASQVFPPILTVLFLAANWQLWTKVIPKAIRIFAVPMMSLLVTVPVALTVLGPLGFSLGGYFTTFVLWLHAHLGWAATTAVAMVLPFLVALGMHKPFVPYIVSQLGAGLPDPFYMAASLAHNISESGAAFAVAIRTKDPELRATGISAGTSAFFGITEPALYGVTLQHKRALWSVLGGCLVAGLYVGITQVNGFVAVGPGLVSMAAYMDPKDANNIVNAFIGFGIAFSVSMALGLILWRDPVKVATDSPSGDVAVPQAAAVAMPHGLAVGAVSELVSPMSGTVVHLAEVDDDAFAQGMLGKGIAIRPDDGTVRAPADGIIDAVDGHAITLITADGVELLIHVGIDTVRLKGRFFTTSVKVGDQVQAGQVLMTADLDAIRAAGFDTTTPIIVRNAAHYNLHHVAAATVAAGEVLLRLHAAEPVLA